MSTIDLVTIIGTSIGILSIFLNIFQFYTGYTREQKFKEQEKLFETVLETLFKNLSYASEKTRSSQNSQEINTTALTEIVESQKNYLEVFIKKYFPEYLQSQQFLDKLYLVEGLKNVTKEQVKILNEANEYVFIIGGRSRNEEYLHALSNRILTNDIRYIRIITGNHVRHPLHEHLVEVWGKVELAYYEEDKFGGILATHDTVFVALQSSNKSILDKGLVIRNLKIAADYRLYIQELLSNSEKKVAQDFIKSLCTKCKNSTGAKKEVAAN